MKKVLSLLLAIFMIVSLLPMPVLADGGLKLVVSDATAKAGEEFTVTVSVQNNPGIASIYAELSYDDTVMELISGAGKITSGTWDIADIATNKTIAWYHTENYTSDGVVLELKFKMKSTAAVNKTGYPVSIWFDPDWDGIFNASDADALACETVSGTVKVQCSHTPGTAVQENCKEATCTVDGSYDEVVYCSVCGEELSRTQKTIAKKNHETELTGAKAADCTTDGYTGDYVCKNCHKTITKGSVIAKLGHKFTIHHSDDTQHWDECEVCHAITEKTAHDKEYTYKDNETHTVTCSDEDCTYTETEAHSGGTATCTVKAVCSFCGHSYGSLGDHNYIEKAEEKYLKTPGSCTQKAVYYKSCSMCGAKSTETFEGSVDSSAHTATHTAYKAATTDNPGNIEYWYCSECSRYFSDAACEHEVTKEQTVISKIIPEAVQISVTGGTVCPEGEITVDVVMSKNPGVASVTADLIYDAAKLELISAVPGISTGSWVDLDDLPQSGTFMWYNTENYYADGTILTLKFKVKKDASLGDVAVNIIFDEEFGGIFTASGTKLDNTVTAGKVTLAGHTTALKNAKAATCTEDGYSGDTVCSVCGKTLTEGSIIKASGHDWTVRYSWNDDWTQCTAKAECKKDGSHWEEETVAVTNEVTTEPGCGVEGVRTYTAVFTEAWAETQTKTGPVEALEHSWVFDHADTTSVPYYNVFRCTNCGELWSEEVETPKATAISFDCGNEVTVYLNKTDYVEIPVTVLPLNAEQTVTWTGMKSEFGTFDVDDNTLRINLSGKTGTVTLTATANDGSNAKGIVKVTVARYADSLNILDSKGKDVETAEIKGKASVSFKTSLAADKTISDKTVIWSLSCEDFATVDSNGKVTVKSFAGADQTVTLNAKSAANPEAADSITLILKPDLINGVNILYDGDIVNNATVKAELTKGTLQLSASPVGVTGDIIWKSSSTKIATVDAGGLVELKGTGTATITAACGSVKSTFKLTVISKVQSIAISGPTVLASGKSASYKAVITEPAKPTDKTLIWSLAEGDEAYATLKSGKLTAQKNLATPVEVTVIVKSGDGGAAAEFPVTLTPIVSAVKITGAPSGKVEMTEPLKLTSVIEPLAACRDVKWTSSNKLFAIDGDGNVTALPGAKAAAVTFTAAAQDGSGKKATVKISFVHYMTAEDFTLASEAVLAAGKTITIPYSVDKSVTNAKLTWTISDTTYATVKNNRITAKKNVTEPVEVTVTATAQDGSGVSRSCKVTLYPAVTSIRIYNGETDVTGKTVNFTDGMSFTLKNDPAASSKVWTAKSSNSALGVELDGNKLTLAKVAGKTIKSGTKVTVTITAADGSGKTAKVIVKVP